MRYLLFLLLSGCCALCPPKIVYIAAECPKPVMLPTSPNYKSDDLAEDAGYKTTIEAYVLDLEVCRGHAEQLENTLNAYGAAYKEYIGNPGASK